MSSIDSSEGGTRRSSCRKHLLKKFFSLVKHLRIYLVLQSRCVEIFSQPNLPSLMESNHFLIAILHFETAAAGNLRILDCVFRPNDFIGGATM